MEKLKEKLSGLRAEADEANARAEEHKEHIKHLELEQIKKEHELMSLRTRVKNLEEQLKKAEDGLLKATDSYHDADQRAEQALSKSEQLEQELVEKEQLHEELDSKYKAAKSEMDELARQFEDM